ncbi:hypothetical protein L596_029475 [Steinernema carpocapsae]|uniref:Uncharacterized protein n=1 Tax=Steinernema carpocapsae TaxID=34508 RepID=A0A4V6XVL9_STECR|nr:hypothetical protein L596_029475 [Steinernema carpocapsae]
MSTHKSVGFQLLSTLSSTAATSSRSPPPLSPWLIVFEVTTILILTATLPVLVMTHETLVSVFYQALLSWKLIPFYRNPKIKRTQLKDVYKYALDHDVPVVNLAELHAITEVDFEDEEKEPHYNFSHEARMFRFERELRHDLIRNDMLCRRSGYVRHSQNRMIVNDMSRIHEPLADLL